ncbi:hypothetical protein BDD12DRAFT_828849 [Trichophaea hybrida]|nr:hypothetical protein BDD12DRAFT_828849 [Trichophaea hybrida]
MSELRLRNWISLVARAITRMALYFFSKSVAQSLQCNCRFLPTYFLIVLIARIKSMRL